MSVLTRELQACLVLIPPGEDGEIGATFTLGPDFSGFKGHFPGNPVLPGVCMVQAMLVLLAAHKMGSPVTLKRIVSAKWFAPVKPGAVLRFACRLRKDKLIETAIRAHITCGETKVADLSLLVICEGKGKDARG
jgi:3-hydroxymyristoyl/3-hydroxydecanoyl-(acyl carrier protein) dehydratase